LVLLSFVVGHIFYNSARYRQYTTTVARNVVEVVNSKGSEGGMSTLEMDDFKSALNLQLNMIMNDHKNLSVKEILLYDHDKSLIGGTYLIVESGEDFFTARKKNVTNFFLPQLTFIRDSTYVDEKRLSLTEDANEEHILLIYYDLADTLSNLKISLEILAITLLVGFAFFSIIGRFRTNSMLSPIDNITSVAKKINGENLALRIDETSAQFELYELVRTINNMMDRIQSSYNKQMRFVSDVSHELRTPVSVISGYGNMLKRWGKDDEEILEESIEAIIKESSAMNDLIEKLLFLARHDSESLKFEFEMADLCRILQEVIKETRLVHSTYKFEIDLKREVIAEVDPQRIKQLSRILIDNALKYSSETNAIRVTLRQTGRYAVFSIRDFGIGISPVDLPNIFDRFYRADESRTRETGGYGLGLPMASVIAIGHGGSITVKSKVDEGSEFIVRLPLAQERSREAGDTAQSA
jgi:signal transduction histidine kinase